MKSDHLLYIAIPKYFNFYDLQNIHNKASILELNDVKRFDSHQNFSVSALQKSIEIKKLRLEFGQLIFHLFLLAACHFRTLLRLTQIFQYGISYAWLWQFCEGWAQNNFIYV